MCLNGLEIENLYDIYWEYDWHNFCFIKFVMLYISALYIIKTMDETVTIMSLTRKHNKIVFLDGSICDVRDQVSLTYSSRQILHMECWAECSNSLSPLCFFDQLVSPRVHVNGSHIGIFFFFMAISWRDTPKQKVCLKSIKIKQWKEC